VKLTGQRKTRHDRLRAGPKLDSKNTLRFQTAVFGPSHARQSHNARMTRYERLEWIERFLEANYGVKVDLISLVPRGEPVWEMA
jgi:hypothetical protein